MTLAYFDCFAGASGDMIVGALLDAGADFPSLARQLASLGVEGLSVRAETTRRAGLSGTKFHVDAPHGHEHEHSHPPHRRLGDILSLIDRADLPDRTRDRARKVFTRLAQAEAKVHAVPIEQVHFHEVGAIDSIADIVGACVCLELLGIDRLCCSPVPLGSGTIRCDHGLMPVPAPATAELLVGLPTYAGPFQSEATTPTGAAFLAALCDEFGPMPAMRVSAVGCGAGTRDGGPLPNLLRVLVGDACDEGAADSVIELSANVDDCTGEVLGATIEKLLAAGCVDAWASPIVMKKSRPGWTVSALCLPGGLAAAEDVLFAETTTFGVRRRVLDRSKLLRAFETVPTPYGPVRIKVGRRGGKVVTASPEFADCLSAAEAHHVSVREVLSAAQAAWREGQRT